MFGRTDMLCAMRFVLVPLCFNKDTPYTQPTHSLLWQDNSFPMPACADPSNSLLICPLLPATGLSLPMSDDVGQGHQRATAYGVTEGYKMLMSGRDMGGVTRADALATPAAPFAAAAASCALPPGLMGPAGTVVDHISGLLGMQLPPALLLGPPAHAPSGSLLDQVHSAGPPSGTATAHHFPPRGSRSPGAAFGSPVASVDRPATAPGTSRLQTLSARLHALCAHRQAQHTAGQVQDGQGLQEWLQNPAAVPMHQHQPAAWALDSSKVSQHPWADSPNRSSSLMAGAVGSHLISSSQAQHVDIMDVDESVGACAGACEPAVQLQLAAPGAAAGRSGPNSAAPSSAAEPKVVSKSRPPLAPCNGRAAAPTAARAGGKGSRKGEKAPPPRWR